MTAHKTDEAEETALMTQKERMIQGLLYFSGDKEVMRDHFRARDLCHDFNACRPSDFEKRDAILRQLIGKMGEKVYFEGPIAFDIGYNTEIGDNFCANVNCVILDVAPVKIGKNVMFGPNVSIFTAGHPLHPETRYLGWEYGIEITIGDNVWLGGGTIVNPGIHIGSNVVIGSGSVVTRDIPDNCIAAGNPARVMRAITDEDRLYYFKRRPFETGGDIQR